MNKAGREIQCLARLDELTPTYDGLLDFLVSEELMTREDAKSIRASSEIPKTLHTRLLALSKANKLQLLEFEWLMLPIERIKLSIVSDRNNREFSYNY